MQNNEEMNEDRPLTGEIESSCFQSVASIVAQLTCGGITGSCGGLFGLMISESTLPLGTVLGSGAGVGCGVTATMLLGSYCYKNPPSCAFFKSETPSDSSKQEEDIFNPVFVPGQDL